MLGLRTRIRLDTEASPADLVFGKSMRIPGDFSPFTAEEPDVRSFHNEFREFMRQLKPVPVSHKIVTKPFLHQGLDTCTHLAPRKANQTCLDMAVHWPTQSDFAQQGTSHLQCGSQRQNQDGKHRTLKACICPAREP